MLAQTLMLRLAEEGGELGDHVVEEAANPILPTVPELFWGAIAFATLFALVKFVLLPPVQKTMQDRANLVRSDLDAADAARSQAGSAASDVSDQLADVRAEATQIIDAARAEAEADRARIIGAAEDEIAAARSEAEAEIAGAREAAMAGVGPSVAGLAADAASRVMNRTVDVSAAQPVVDRFLNSSN